MTQYNTSNVKISNPQHIKLKSGMENGTEATLKLSLNFRGESNDEEFPNKLLLTNTQVSKFQMFCK